MHRIACSRPIPPATVSHVPKLNSETSSGPFPKCLYCIFLLMLVGPQYSIPVPDAQIRRCEAGAESKSCENPTAFADNAMGHHPQMTEEMLRVPYWRRSRAACIQNAEHSLLARFCNLRCAGAVSTQPLCHLL